MFFGSVVNAYASKNMMQKTGVQLSCTPQEGDIKNENLTENYIKPICERMP